MGRLAEPITPIRTADLVEVHRMFAEPIGAVETIARTIGKLAPELCAALALRGLGARRLDLIFERVDSKRVAVAVGVAQPTRDPRHLTRLLCARIDAIDPGFGIERMRLAATLAEPMVSRQSASDLVEAQPPDVADLISTCWPTPRAAGSSIASPPSGATFRSARCAV